MKNSRLLFLALLFLSGASLAYAGIRPVMKIKYFRGHQPLAAHGTPKSIVTAGYHWAVFQPEMYRYETRFQLPQMNYGPTWVAKRRIYADARVGMTHSYDFLTPDSKAQLVARAHGVFWWKGNPPPPVEFYWKNRQAPEWFVKKQYDLFYPLENNQWWARNAAGKWDIIANEELGEEDGRGPQIEVPHIIFHWEEKLPHTQQGSKLPAPVTIPE
jgi:hypothetical protein